MFSINDGERSSVGRFLKGNIHFRIRDDISVFIPHIFESLYVEIISQSEEKNPLNSWCPI